MDKNGAGSFIYAKASGILGKSFIGNKAQILFEQKSLEDFWNLLFKTPVPLVPEVLLAQQIEKTAFTRFLDQYKYFISLYDNPSSVLIDQLYVYEIENLKEAADSLCNGQTVPPVFVDLGKLSKLNLTAWPDIAKITANSDFSWYNHVPEIHEQQQMDFRLDLQLIRHLWKSVNSEKGEDRDVLLEMYKEEYIIKNIVWALRLKIYYKMSKDDIIRNLLYVTDSQNLQDPIASMAIKILDYPLDNYEVWQNWKFSELVNPNVEGGLWQIDPSWIEQLNRTKLNKMALRIFHQYPMSVCALIGWYKIKKYELHCIKTAVESLRLNINPSEAMAAAGILE
ncbi:MAG: V-type ATPase subunit [Spirochaetales bacterium]|nr:V-type ATPase subunit [Spirochaetales bacterium]